MQGYYFITNSLLSVHGIFYDVECALRAGVCAVQYRSKETPLSIQYIQALKLRSMCKGKTIFIVNDRLDLALAVKADGVHLGQEDLPCLVARRIAPKKMIIGISVHSVEEAKKAQSDGADYISVGPIFATKTKSDAKRPCGIDLIKKVKQAVDIPVVAIGGINLSNAKQVVKAGADALCAISAVITKKDVLAEILKFQKLFNFKKR
ncbi:MAG: thiamine phosphate synthase [Candidatus Omnitrophica bacterium]|nr:thiamine phosphate synthase [Candidatus Omnitrophota bacterium]